MPRNGSGTYVLPVPPFTPGTVISSSDVNSDFSDIATALTGSLAADGQTSLTGQLKGSSGTTPPFTISGDTNTGFGSPGTDQAYIMAGGVQTIVCTTAGATVTGSLTTSTLVVSSTSTFSDVITETTATADTLGLELICTDAGASSGPILSLYRNSASPAASDFAGGIWFYGKDSGGNKQRYGYFVSQIVDATDTSEDIKYYLNGLVNGADTTLFSISGTVCTISSPTITLPSSSVARTALSGSAMTMQVLTSGSGATYTTPAGARSLRIRMIGGGGGGSGTSTSGGTGNTTTFDTVSVAGGSGGTLNGTGGLGGTGGAGSALYRVNGADGHGNTIGGGGSLQNGEHGGSGVFGGGGRAGVAGKPNTGGGGGGGWGSNNIGAGGGSGEYAEYVIQSPAASYTYTVGTGGTAGTGGAPAGAAGGSGVIIVEEYY